MRLVIADFHGNPAAADWHFLGSTATNLQALTRIECGKENWENCWQGLSGEKKIEKIVDFDKTN